MAIETGRQIQVIIVTPERAVLDEPADMVILPMYDGEFGVQPGHSPFVGQLGPGELRLVARGSTMRRFFVDGGFAQVRANVVNVLTPKAIPANEVTPAVAEQARMAAEAMPESNPAEQATRQRAIERAKGMARIAAKSG
jgi:F-type H+-transporting ATPase subunit epsilon